MPASDSSNHPGKALFISQRGYEGGQCFFDDDDYRHYRETLRLALTRHGMQLYAYCLIRDHVQLLLGPAGGNISQLLREVCLQHSQYRAERSGARLMLWESRYRGRQVPGDERILRCYRYIEEHPVSLGLAHSAAAYRWSSFHHNAYGLGDPLVSEHPARRALAEDESEARQNYRAMFESPLPLFDRAPASMIYAA